MLKIIPIPALSDNYIWLMMDEDTKQAIIIDPSVSDKVLDFLIDNQLTPIAILLTHEHNDHIGGVAGILKDYPNVPIYCHQTHYQHSNVIYVENGDDIVLLSQVIQVFDSAGHTANHLSFAVEYNHKVHLFCGDTLFKAGCGRVFTGTIEQLYQSFCFLNELDKLFNISDNDIYFYPAHEYTLSNLNFAKFLEPNNYDIGYHINQDTQLRDNYLATLPTTLNTERKINPFLRALQPNDELFNHAIKNGFDNAKNPTALFAFLRQLKNNF